MRIRAVIVVEHRNVNTLLGKSVNFKDAIVILTAGYPSTATVEFLHLLSKDRELEDVPFLFISDHDFQAVHIFTV